MENLKKKLKKLLNEDIIDIILFGSKAKNKIVPNDIDIAVITNSQVLDIKKSIRNVAPNADIQQVSLEDIHSPIYLSLIKEGYSIKKQKYLHEIYRIKPVKLYKYSLKQLTNSKKVMFERAIKNFKKLERLSNRVVLVPIDHTGEFEDFLRLWDLDIDTKEYELVPLIRKE